MSPGPSNTIAGSLEPDSRDPKTDIGNLEAEERYIGYMTHWKRDDGKRSEFYGGGGTFYSASRREEKGEGLGEERVRRLSGREAGGFRFQCFFGVFFGSVSGGPFFYVFSSF